MDDHTQDDTAMMEEEEGNDNDNDNGVEKMQLTAQSAQSRILVSDSLMKQQQQDQEAASNTTTATAEEDAQQQQPHFPKLSAIHASNKNKIEYRRVRCPSHRYTPLREHWEQILTPLVEFLKLQVRFNTRTRSVEMKTSQHTVDTGALQKGADFVSAFMLGFDVQDAVALLRLDDLYVESFQIADVKSMLAGDHLSRAIGRIAGQDGKTKFAIENATRTRIVIANDRIHLLGSFGNLKIARNAICDLILGAPPGKVYNRMRNVAKRMTERY